MTTRSKADRDATLKAAIAALPASKRGRSAPIPVTADFMPGIIGIIHEAAKERGITSASFVRRAALAMACHDLELPLADILERDPRIARQSGFGVEDPAGTIFGRWEIERLVGEGED